MSSCDVAIIGGGPGGSCLAGLLASRGYRVTLVERQAFPRFKIGESLLPQSCAVLDKLGVMPQLQQRFLRKNGATFVCGTSQHVQHFAFADAFDKRFDHAFQVQRADFDKLLLDRAQQLGATVLQPCHVREVVFDGTRATAVRCSSDQLGELTISAKFIVDASGRGAMLAAKQCGRQRIEGLDQSSVYACYDNVGRQAGDLAGNIAVVMLPEGWMWLIPFRDGTTSIGAVMRNTWFRERRQRGRTHDELLDEALASSTWAQQITATASRRHSARATGDFSYSVGQVHGDGWLAVGDAAGFVDPLFSSGVHLAIKGADIAADALVESLDDPQQTPRAMARYADVLGRARNLFLGAVQATYNGRLGELIFAEHQRPMIRRMITSMLAGDVFHPADDLPRFVRIMAGMYQGGIDRMADAVQMRKATPTSTIHARG